MKTNLKELFEHGEYRTAIEHLADRGIKATLREDKKIVCEQADYERAVTTLAKAYQWGEINSPMTVTTLLEHFSLESIVKRFPKEINDWKQGQDFSDDLFHALYDYYFDEMPYGTKKARDGDPYEWISDRLDQDLGHDEVEESMPAQEAVVDEANGAHMFVIGDTVYHDNKKGVVDRQEGNKVFVHTGDGEMDVFPGDETSLTRQGALPTMRKHINQIARGMKGFVTGRPELEEADETEGRGPVVTVHKAYSDNIRKAKDTLERFHHSEGIGKKLKLHPPSGNHGPDYYEFHLDKKPHNSVEAVKRSLDNDGIKYGSVHEGSMNEEGHTATETNVDAIKRLAGLRR
jgi:hypothetical protein